MSAVELALVVAGGVAVSALVFDRPAGTLGKDDEPPRISHVQSRMWQHEEPQLTAVRANTHHGGRAKPADGVVLSADDAWALWGRQEGVSRAAVPVQHVTRDYHPRRVVTSDPFSNRLFAAEDFESMRIAHT